VRKAAIVIAALFFVVAVVGCAKRVEKRAGLPTIPSDLPPAPREGASLAKSAEKVPIVGGPSSPVRKVLWQKPQARPCWAITEGAGCPLDEPGHIAFLGISSGAEAEDGAVLNAYQNAVEALARYCYERSRDKSPESRELARARAYYAAGINDKSYRLMQGTWVQKWEERYRDYMRIYFRAFTRLVISEEEIEALVP